jgi:hypothetical protein
MMALRGPTTRAAAWPCPRGSRSRLLALTLSACSNPPMPVINGSASAAAGSPNTHTGTYGRFFAGPPPAAPVTAWQGSGGQVTGAYPIWGYR